MIVKAVNKGSATAFWLWHKKKTKKKTPRRETIDSLMVSDWCAEYQTKSLLIRGKNKKKHSGSVWFPSGLWLAIGITNKQAFYRDTEPGLMLVTVCLVYNSPAGYRDGYRECLRSGGSGRTLVLSQ